MVNRARGEVGIVVDGEERPMRLTLGGLAELEERLAAGSLVGLAERFESGQVATGDLIALLAAGLKGAGVTLSEADLARAEIAGGALGAMRAGLALMAASFREDG